MSFHSQLRSVVILLPALAACGTQAPPALDAARASNVLLVVLDDVGLDLVSCYPQASPDARTPTLDALAARGLRFETVWANPWCSPTRATLMTGRYSFRTGIGSVIDPDSDDDGLALEERCIPEALQGDDGGERRIRTALLGKWHLSTNADGLDNPRQQGFEVFRGTLGNLGSYDQPERYFAYEEVRDGESVLRERYATSAVVDDTIEAIERFGDDPWLVVASFHAAHMPFHAPPEDLTGSVLEGRPLDHPRAYLVAMVTALDRELGRLLDALGPEARGRTHIVVVGDNGTTAAGLAATAPKARSKGSLFETGVRVPLIVAGPAVSSPGSVSSALVNTADLFSTCIELLTGRPPTATDGRPLDGVSLVPVLAQPDAPGPRAWIFAERFQSAEHTRDGVAQEMVAVRDSRYKLVDNRRTGVERMFDLETDPEETHDLLGAGAPTAEVAAARDALASVLSETLGR